MSLSKADPTTLMWDVFTIKRPGLSRDLPPGKEELMWVANSSTLIYGEQDAILVDTFLTIEQSQILLDRVLASGKNLTTIYVTHAPWGPLLWPRVSSGALPTREGSRDSRSGRGHE